MRVVLAIAASDSSGCAGIQADIRAITANGGHAATVLTSVTAQSSLRVLASFPMSSAAVRAQLEAVLSDLPVAAVKSGVLGSCEAVEAIAAALGGHRMPYVLDPVLTATAGGPLSSEEVIAAMCAQLFPLATLVTPNAREAEALTRRPVRDRKDAARAGGEILASGCGAVLIKGGHLADDPCTDVLVERSGVTVFEGTPIASANTRGTGCTIASTIATYMAGGASVPEAVKRARERLATAIRGGYALPGGGPVDAFAPWRPLIDRSAMVAAHV